MEKMMLSVEETQELLGISRPVTYALVKSEGFPAIRIGRKILVPRKQLEEWVEKNLSGRIAEA